MTYLSSLRIDFDMLLISLTFVAMGLPLFKSMTVGNPGAASIRASDPLGFIPSSDWLTDVKKGPLRWPHGSFRVLQCGHHFAMTATAWILDIVGAPMGTRARGLDFVEAPMGTRARGLGFVEAARGLDFVEAPMGTRGDLADDLCTLSHFATPERLMMERVVLYNEGSVVYIPTKPADRICCVYIVRAWAPVRV